jgi:hypothetical protein
VFTGPGPQGWGHRAGAEESRSQALRGLAGHAEEDWLTRRALLTAFAEPGARGLRGLQALHTHAHAHARTRAHTHTYTQAHTHTHTHARAHTHTHRPPADSWSREDAVHFPPPPPPQAAPPPPPPPTPPPPQPTAPPPPYFLSPPPPADGTTVLLEGVSLQELQVGTLSPLFFLPASLPPPCLPPCLLPSIHPSPPSLFSPSHPQKGRGDSAGGSEQERKRCVCQRERDESPALSPFISRAVLPYRTRRRPSHSPPHPTTHARPGPMPCVSLTLL